ncbi:hypothetical protein E6O75_ATG00142 [Venturia nashicola]|uniref:Phosphoglycerate mutase family protein n=1 Tax=Venturia nashicola TaxID=86259 RepID=A0A4Z1PD03_9PEZI|nr:hypothetical protein E6O75_ATG00142 [Venturia nashicola]
MWLPTLLVLAAQAHLVFSATSLVTKPSKPTVFFIRHGEKPPFGDGLSVDGLQRAECLRNVFAKNSSFHINLIIAQKPQPDGSRKRPYDTVLPLSRDLGLKVYTHCERDDVACVGETIRDYKGRGNILVCWEHRTMSNITYLLGDMNPPLYPTSDHVDDNPLNQNCPGLDISEPLSGPVIALFIGLGVILLLGVGGAIYAIFRLTKGDDDGYEPIE